MKAFLLRHKLGMTVASVILLLILTLGLMLTIELKQQFGELPREGQFAGLANFRDGRFRNLEPVVLNRGQLAKRPGMFRFLLDSPNRPKQAPSFARPNFEMTDSVTWLGHSTLLFRMGEAVFVTDPVFGNAAPLPGIVSRYTPPVILPSELPKLDFVLLTHDHYDHLERSTIRRLMKTTDLFIVPLGVGARLRGWGVPPERIRELNWGDSVTVKGLKVTATTARHFSGRSWYDRDRTLWASYVLEGSERKVFFGGDGGFGRHFFEIGRQYGPFDLALLEIDAWNVNWPNNHMFPEEIVKALRLLGARHFLPIHWGVFDLAMHPYGESIGRVRESVRNQGWGILEPKAGETLPLPSPSGERRERNDGTK